MKAAWLTDIHLNCLGNDGTTPQRRQMLKKMFFESVADDNPDVIFITGDVSTGTEIVNDLTLLESVVRRPIYFVAGNHDFYGSSFDDVTTKLTVASQTSDNIKYLYGCHTPRKLTDTTCVIGADGWYDMLHGDWRTSDYVLNDWFRISEFYMSNVEPGERHLGVDIKHIINVSRKHARECAQHILGNIQKAVAKGYSNVIILTHVPPFASLHLFEGRHATKDALPYYTSKIMGDMLIDVAEKYPNVKLTCLSGHTHCAAREVIRDNLTCIVGGAEYGRPRHQIIELW